MQRRHLHRRGRHGARAQPEHRARGVLPGRVGTAVRRRRSRSARARSRARRSSRPTSLQFGPDGRLYVAQQNGVIKVYTVSRDARRTPTPSTATETINAINSDAQPQRRRHAQRRGRPGRLVTGLLVDGHGAPTRSSTSRSSDPRIGAGEGGADLNLDTNSGIVSKLTKTGSSVGEARPRARPAALGGEPHRQRPRAQRRRQHALRRPGRQHEQGRAVEQLRAACPSTRCRPRSSRSTSHAIGNTTYDLPTLDDEPRRAPPTPTTRSAATTANQARARHRRAGAGLRAGLPQPLRRRDHRVGKMYTIDNGGNAGWGDAAAGRGPRRHLHERARTSRGRPTATPSTASPGRATTAAIRIRRAPTRPTRSAARRRSPGAANPVECDFRSPGAGQRAGQRRRRAGHVPGSSTNGLAEYTASNFGGAMKGDLLAAGCDRQHLPDRS